MHESLYCLCFVLTLLLNAISPTRVSACDSSHCSCSGRDALVHSRHPGCWIATSDNFQVCSFQSEHEANHVALHCEKIRESLSASYGLAASGPHWEQKCKIFLHPNKQKYGAVVGKDFMQTLGSSLVQPATGKVANRRIDLRRDVADYLEEVLPHELCHVLIADQFRSGAPPLWYDEGLALLADSRPKQALHQQELRNGLTLRKGFSLRELLMATEYPPADRVGVFYGQCASLARCLSREGSSERIHQFAKRSKEIGVNLALKECYGIPGLPELEQTWRKSLNSTSL